MDIGIIPMTDATRHQIKAILTDYELNGTPSGGLFILDDAVDAIMAVFVVDKGTREMKVEEILQDYAVDSVAPDGMFALIEAVNAIAALYRG